MLLPEGFRLIFSLFLRAGFFSVELSSLENVYGSSTDCTMLKQDCEDFNLPRISRIDTKKYLMASVM
ncbi:hypothetical protein Csa_014844 [Cucumis sativus]|nr:hypothetical protein Csa_014844 [Cucumis sativus]